MACGKVNSSRARSNGLADSSCDPVSQHMRAWKLYQHELKIQRVKPWENCHVNPGRKSNNFPPKAQPMQIPSRSFSRLSLQPTNNLSRPPSSLRSLQPNNRKKVRISYSAHADTHKKFEDGNVMTFQPKILDTPVTSRLIQSRNYQPPKRKSVQKCRIGSASSVATSSKSVDQNQQTNSNNKTWSQRRPESSCSSSTVCDSAYEAGGSIEGFSPHSRCSTPRNEVVQSNSSSKKSSNVDAEGGSKTEAKEEVEEVIEEEIQRPHSPVEFFDRNESLDYILFEHDLMNEIALAGVVTNTSVKEICRTFVAAHSKSLDSIKVQDIVERVRNELGVPESDSHDFSEFGIYNCTNSQSSNLEPVAPELNAE